MRGKMKIRKTTLLLTLIASLVAMTFAMLPASAPTASLAVNPRVTDVMAPGPGGMFTVSVEVDDVTQMFGYEFRLQWNEDVLEYANYVPNAPFIYPWPSSIEPGQADIAWSYFPSALKGFNTTDPYPVGTFVFNVVGSGYSELDLKNTILRDTYAAGIDHTVDDGYFINVPPVEKADLTAWKAKAQYQPNWDTSVSATNQLRARVWNKGTVGLNVKVVFTISNGTHSITRHTNTAMNLQPGGKVTLYYTLTGSDLNELSGVPFTYEISAQASYWKITMSQPLTPNGATIKTFNINVS